jgi:anti-sigma-K factor RskA
MSAPELSPEELLAAEFALGLLEGEALLEARGRFAREPHFAARVAWWEDRVAPLLDELGGAEPGPELWARIERAIAEGGRPGEGASGEVVLLRQKLRYWQATAAMAMAASIAALVFALLPLLRGPSDPSVAPAGPAAGPPLVASIPIADTPLRLVVTYIPDSRELLVSAAGLTADGVHDHELWLVPDQGALRSLGVVKPGHAVRVALDSETASKIHAGSRMVLTREPQGGKPPSAEAGPVVAEGAFTRT